MKIYCDQAGIPADLRHTDLMIPFWGHYGPGSDLHHLRTWRPFGEFEAWASDHWELAPAGDADVALLPFDGGELLHQEGQLLEEAWEAAHRFVGRASSAGLRTVVTVRSDQNDPLPLGDTAIVLRHSLDRRTRRPNEFALSDTFSELIVDPSIDDPAHRSFREVPVVGFCGFAASRPPPLKRRLKVMAARCADRFFDRYVPEGDGQYLRRHAIEVLKRAADIDVNIVLRPAPFFGLDRDEATAQRLRREYTSNLLNSDYVLCVRGWGNHSVRFFEAMSVGRIPVLVDTECVLPYDFSLEYGDICVIVPADDVDNIAEYIMRFHHGIGRDGFVQVQKEVAELWRNWLSPKGFAQHLATHWEGS